MKPRSATNIKKLLSPKTIVILYAAIAILAGSFWVFGTPLGEGPDVWLHVYRIDSILNGDFFPHKVSATSAYHHIASENYGGAVSWDIVNLSLEYSGSDTGVVNLDSIDSFTENTADVAFNNTAIYNPVGYLPYLITLSISNFFQMSPIFSYYAMGFMGLVFCVLITSVGVYLLPKYRIPLAILLLIPYIPLPFGSFTYTAYSAPYNIGVDSLLFATATFFTCLLFRAYWQQPTKKLLIMMMMAGAICSISKFSYTPLVLASLGLLCINTKTRDCWRPIIIVGGCIFAFAVTLVWIKIGGGFATSPGSITYSLIQQKTATLFAPPFTGITEVIGAIVGHQAYEGSRLQGYMILLFQVFIIITFVITLRLSFKKIIDKGNSVFLLICLVSAVAVMFAVYLALWLQYTPVGIPGVEGVQSRYFVPTAPIVFLVLCEAIDRILNNKKNTLPKSKSSLLDKL